MAGVSLKFLAFLLVSSAVDAFSRDLSPRRTGGTFTASFDLERRQAIAFLPAALFFPTFAQSSEAVMENKQQVFTAGRAMGVPEAKARFLEARKALAYLVDNYDSISKGGGDNVRRYLGTVGTTSALYGINKVIKELQEEADDIIEYTENASEFDYSLRAADTAVYSANFVEYSAAKTKPEKFFEDALIEAEHMQDYMDAMAAELKLK